MILLKHVKVRIEFESNPKDENNEGLNHICLALDLLDPLG